MPRGACAHKSNVFGSTLVNNPMKRRLFVLIAWAAVLAAAAHHATAQRLLPPLPYSPLPELETDRETFTPATSTAGKNLWIVESSYSFIDNRDAPDTNSFPELLTRYGLTERIELRIGWNYEAGGGGNVVSPIESSEGIAGKGFFTESHALYGLKAAVTRQQGWIPRSSAILEGFTPTSGDAPASQPVATYVFGWLFGNHWRFDTALRYTYGNEDHDAYNKWAPSTVLRIPINDRLQVHFGYFGVFTQGREIKRTRAFVSPGMHFNFTPNFELGLRVGWGITPDAANFFANTGFGWRF